MYSTLVIIILGYSITNPLHLLIHKRECVPSTTLLALHRLHPLLLPPLLLLMIRGETLVLMKCFISTATFMFDPTITMQV